MQEWFYIVDGEQRGPVSESELRGKLRSGMLARDTLVWRDGMADWASSATIPELAAGREHTAGDGDGAAWAAGPQVRPWVRCFARSIDVMLFSIVAGVIIGTVAPASMIEGNLVVPLLMLLGYAFVEPLLLSRWGTTPGKALLRTRVRRMDGEVLGYREALDRSLYVWARGLGMGLPIVGLIAEFLAYQDLVSNGSTAWDRQGNFRVEHAPIGPRRTVITALILAVGVGLALAGQAMG